MKPGPPLKREIRVFISSTFSDMQQERNYLVKKVFPDIERECQRRNVEFIPLDLRWGITEEEAQRGKVVEICFNEIDRTRPFFIGLLGGRYGWVPGSGDDFDPNRLSQNMPWIKPYLNKKISITEMEMRYGVLDNKEPIHAHFFIRHDRDIPQKFQESDAKNKEKLLSLKQNIRKAAAEGFCTVSDYGSVKSLGKHVRRQLMEMIDELFPKEKTATLYDLYAAHQQQRLLELRRFYHPRATNSLSETVNSNRRVVIYPESTPGCGVSAVVANEIPDDIVVNDAKGLTYRPRVIRSFVDSEVNSMEMLKRIFIHTLHTVYPHIDVPELSNNSNEPIDFDSILERFPKEKYMWIIDGPEKLADKGERNLQELVKGLQQIDHLIIATSSYDIEAICSENDFDFVEISNPTDEELRAITTLYLRYYGKALNERQISAITGSNIFSNVNLLILFLDILRNFGVYEDVDKFIHTFVSLDGEEEFYNRYLDYLEEEFSHDSIREFFQRLMVPKAGISEKSLFKDLVKSRIEQSSMMSAVERLLARRFHNLFLPEGNFSQLLVTRYPLEKNDSDRITQMVLKDYRRRVKEIKSDKNSSTPDWIFSRIVRILLRGILLTDDTALQAEFFSLQKEILMLHINAGEDRKALRILRHFGLLSCANSDIYNMEAIASLMKRNKKRPHEMLDSYDVYIGSKIFDGHMLPLIWNQFNNTPEEMEIFRKGMGRKLLPRKIKRQLMEDLEGTDSVKFIDLWDENIDAEDYPAKVYLDIQFKAVQILAYRDEAYVQRILEKIQRTLNRMEGNSIYETTFLKAATFCAIRLRDKKKYEEFSSHLKLSKYFHSLKYDAEFFEIIISLQNVGADIGSVTSSLNKFIESRGSQALENGIFQNVLCQTALMYDRHMKGDEPTGEEKRKLIKNRGEVVEALYYSGMEHIAGFIIPALLETDLSNENRAIYRTLYGDIHMKLREYPEAIAEYAAVLGMAEKTRNDQGSWSVERLLCALIKGYTEVSDFDGLERISKRYISYAEEGILGCTKDLAYNRVSNGFYYLYEKIKSRDDAQSLQAKEKSLEYALKAYETTPSDYILWINYANSLLTLVEGDIAGRTETRNFIEAGKNLLATKVTDDPQLIEYLGRMFLRASMTKDFEKLLRTHPDMSFGRTPWENLLNLIKIERNGKIRDAYIDELVTELRDLILIFITPNEIKRLNTDILMPLIIKCGAAEEIASRLVLVDDDWKYSVGARMLAARIFTALGKEKKGEELEKEAALYLLTGEGRDDSFLYEIYLVFQPLNLMFNIETIRRYIAAKYIEKDVEKREIYIKGLDALYDKEAMTYFFEQVIGKVDDMALIEKEAQMFKEYSERCDSIAFLQFCLLLNKERIDGRELPPSLVRTVAEVAEIKFKEIYEDKKYISAAPWNKIADLLRLNGNALGKYMILNGILASDLEECEVLYQEYYSDVIHRDDKMVVLTYLDKLYGAEEWVRYESLLQKVKSEINQNNKYWPKIHTQCALNYRRKGDYSAAMESFHQLSAYCQKEGVSCYDYIHLLFPAVTSLLAGDYEEFRKECDFLKKTGKREEVYAELLNCTYVLKVDNFTTAERLYNSVNEIWGINHNNLDFECDETDSFSVERKRGWDQELALLAYRFIELSRYHLRHAASWEEIKDAFAIAENILAKIPGEFPYFHNELSQLRKEIGKSL